MNPAIDSQHTSTAEVKAIEDLFHVTRQWRLFGDQSVDLAFGERGIMLELKLQFENLIGLLPQESVPRFFPCVGLCQGLQHCWVVVDFLLALFVVRVNHENQVEGLNLQTPLLLYTVKPDILTLKCATALVSAICLLPGIFFGALLQLALFFLKEEREREETAAFHGEVEDAILEGVFFGDEKFFKEALFKAEKRLRLVTLALFALLFWTCYIQQAFLFRTELWQLAVNLL